MTCGGVCARCGGTGWEECPEGNFCPDGGDHRCLHGCPESAEMKAALAALLAPLPESPAESVPARCCDEPGCNEAFAFYDADGQWCAMHAHSHSSVPADQPSIVPASEVIAVHRYGAHVFAVELTGGRWLSAPGRVIGRVVPADGVPEGGGERPPTRFPEVTTNRLVFRHGMMETWGSWIGPQFASDDEQIEQAQREYPIDLADFEYEVRRVAESEVTRLRGRIAELEEDAEAGHRFGTHVTRLLDEADKAILAAWGAFDKCPFCQPEFGDEHQPECIVPVALSRRRRALLDEEGGA